jgi:hypothetical protein
VQAKMCARRIVPPQQAFGTQKAVHFYIMYVVMVINCLWIVFYDENNNNNNKLLIPFLVDSC